MTLRLPFSCTNSLLSRYCCAELASELQHATELAQAAQTHLSGKKKTPRALTYLFELWLSGRHLERLDCRECIGLNGDATVRLQASKFRHKHHHKWVTCRLDNIL
jgi:hypothetical protein